MGGLGTAKNGVVNGVESSKLITAHQRQLLAFEAYWKFVLSANLTVALGEDSSAVSSQVLKLANMCMCF